MSEITYYVDVYRNGVSPWTNPENIFDGNENTYGYSSASGEREFCDETNCPGTNLGTITAVDIRVLGNGDGGDHIDLQDQTGILGAIVPLTSKGWSSYLSLPARYYNWDTIKDFGTDDANVRYIYFDYDASGKSNQIDLYKVEIRVTYTPSGVGQPTMKRWHGVPGMNFTGRKGGW